MVISLTMMGFTMMMMLSMTEMMMVKMPCWPGQVLGLSAVQLGKAQVNSVRAQLD